MTMNHSTWCRIFFRKTAIAISVFVLGLGLIPTARAKSRKPHSPGMAAEPPRAPGSVSGAPQLPTGLADTFTSRYVDIGGLRLHAVIGGKGRPLLLIHGWPQTWYQWRLV